MSEPPFDDGRRSRSDAASRLAAMLADTGDDLVLPDDPDDGDDGRASTEERGSSPSVAAIAARPAPVQPSPDAPRRPRRARRDPADRADAAETAVLAEASQSTGSERSTPPADAPDPQQTATGRDGASDEDVEEVEDVEALEATTDEDTGEVWADWDSLLLDEEADPGSAPDVDAPRPDPGPPKEQGTLRPATAVALAAAPVAASPSPTSPTPSTAPDADDSESSSEPPVRLRRITLRSVAFGTVLALLVAAVPALAWVGKERLLDSRGGELVAGGTDVDEPGYNALVVPTVNGLVLQRDSEGTITGTTLLALGAGSEGGTVLQVPMNTAVREQKFLFDRLSAVAGKSSDELYSREVADLLNVGIPVENVVTIDDESVASLTAPVAPLIIDNPDAVVTDDGEEIPAGTIELSADQIGPYMRARVEGESELARLARTEAVWSAWLAAVGEVGVEAGVGQGFTDIGPFIRTLAAGEPVVQTLDVALPDESDQDDPPYVPADGFDDQILDAVPYPTSPGAGRRWELELYNGADPTADIPREMMRQLIGQGAALTRLGNATEVGRSDTLIEYSSSQWREAADRAAFVLGGDSEVRQMSEARAEQAGADVVITFGSETLDRDWGDG